MKITLVDTVRVYCGRCGSPNAVEGRLRQAPTLVYIVCPDCGNWGLVMTHHKRVETPQHEDSRTC